VSDPVVFIGGLVVPEHSFRCGYTQCRRPVVWRIEYMIEPPQRVCHRHLRTLLLGTLRRHDAVQVTRL
jgi:hypothetical protein